MVVTTRSRSAKVPTKIKFSEADNSLNEVEYHTAEENEEEEEESSSEDSDDDAPEEESLSTAKQDIINKQKKQKELEAQRRKEERERRRELDLKNKEQKSKKKEREQPQQEENELPDFLPDDLIEAIENDGLLAAHTQSKHLKVQDFEEMDQKLLRQKIKQEKLRAIKLSKKLSVNKGPVQVKVQSFNSNKKLVPKSESRIVKSKDKWLKRKSLNRK
ncbi:predicted protein [Scheffersomyces stipitis CBS 6054]|uniref:Uncharacterized protein n=1 Tax=Scheffersomyces stipitis (strain ATCC 58785 / CBS 6054 / NBRC 10063 / NRRL Y-11545) TaxID=322104 RepID=A3LNH1_PICST|nr:predicted protein [Scheffersomyces stipitis CBS 6054]ABN64854.2 predicted protein [Scheffersomyces stipitis CBS 6054]KAG2736902.1 hypothetical protein G9P44_000992 [Scheffersomyces stipitis]